MASVGEMTVHVNMTDLEKSEMFKGYIRDLVQKDLERSRSGVLEALRDALEEDECHHKQWYLWKLAKVLGLSHSLEDIEDKGIAP